MRVRTLVIGFVAAAALAACGGSGSSSSSPTTAASSSSPPTTAHVAHPVAANPSDSAKMVCEPEAQNEIYQEAIGIKTTSVTKPTWIDHVYSCTYMYPGGASFKLSVKELADTDQTTAYFNMVGEQMGRGASQVIGQGAFVTKNGSVVVRKDYKVLTVDISRLPAQFGVPSDTRANVALNIANVIMGCWTGA